MKGLMLDAHTEDEPSPLSGVTELGVGTPWLTLLA